MYKRHVCRSSKRPAVRYSAYFGLLPYVLVNASSVSVSYTHLDVYKRQELAYMMPVGTGDVKPVLEALIKDAEEMGAKLRRSEERRVGKECRL